MTTSTHFKRKKLGSKKFVCSYRLLCKKSVKNESNKSAKNTSSNGLILYSSLSLYLFCYYCIFTLSSSPLICTLTRSHFVTVSYRRANMCVCVCVCVIVLERERESEYF